MKTQRALHKDRIQAHHRKIEEKAEEKESLKSSTFMQRNLPESSKGDIEETFQKIILPKKRKIDDLYKSKKKIRDENYIPYVPKDKHTEEG